MKLYMWPKSRSIIIEWYFKEIGVKYENAVINMEEKEHKSPAYLKINPFGKVPAFEDDGIVLTESGAVLLYVGEKVGDIKTTKEKADAYNWVLFGNSTLAENFINEAARKERLPGVLESLNHVLEGLKDQYLTGAFSVCDVAVGSYLLFIPILAPDVDMARYPNVVAYMERLKARPAWKELEKAAFPDK